MSANLPLYLNLLTNFDSSWIVSLIVSAVFNLAKTPSSSLSSFSCSFSSSDVSSSSDVVSSSDASSLSEPLFSSSVSKSSLYSSSLSSLIYKSTQQKCIYIFSSHRF